MKNRRRNERVPGPVPPCKPGRIHIGTAGWSYPHWIGSFYPQDLRAGAELGWYSRCFGSVEVNNTFYRLPRPRTVASWREQVPDDFLFSVKASRYLTHVRKLRDAGAGTLRLIEAISGLGPTLGPLLFQLPPHWKRDAERLNGFLQALPADQRYAIELRDPSWLHLEILDILRRHRVALCVYDLAGYTTPMITTAPFIYVRLHGPGAPYCGSYSEAALAHWATLIRHWQQQGKDVYCYFDNDELAYAPHNAAVLSGMLGLHPSTVPHPPRRRSLSRPAVHHRPR